MHHAESPASWLTWAVEDQLCICDLLDSLFEREAPDLILSAGAPPAFRVDGNLVSGGGAKLTPEDTDRLVRELLAP